MIRSEIISYFFESSISLAIFYLFYWLFLRKQTYYCINRLFLLGAVLFSSVLPFANFSIQGFNVSNSPLIEFFSRIGYVIKIPEIVKTVNERTDVNYSPQWFIICYYVYLTGVTIFSIKFLTGIVKILVFVTKHKITKYKGLNLIFTDHKFAPFSFFNFIFINKSLIDIKQLDKIIEHECAHIKQLHTLDILFIELFLIIQWFNPIIWLIKRSLKETHEYLADNSVVNRGFDLTKYQTLLLYQIRGLGAIGLTNNFNKSLIKKRIIMMLKAKSPGSAKLKVLLFVPILLVIIWIFACSKSENTQIENELQPEVQEVRTNFITEADIPVEPVTNPEEEPVFYIVEEMPDFQGKGVDGFREYIANNLSYPESAANNGISGRVFIRFIIETDGSVNDAEIIRGVDLSLDEEALRLVKSSPKWTPGKQRGIPVRVAYTFPIAFVLQ
jgi:TonB family protein